MKNLLAIVVLLITASFAWGQCPGGSCTPATTPVKKTVSVLVSPAKQVVAGTRQRIERRPLLRRIFRRGR